MAPGIKRTSYGQMRIMTDFKKVFARSAVRAFSTAAYNAQNQPFTSRLTFAGTERFEGEKKPVESTRTGFKKYCMG